MTTEEDPQEPKPPGEHDRFPFLVTPKREKKLDAIIDGSIWRQRLGELVQKYGLYVALIFGTFLTAGDKIKAWAQAWLSGPPSP